jgi:hypothetical protein
MIFKFIRRKHKSFFGFPEDYYYRYEITCCFPDGIAHSIFHECSKDERELFRLGVDEYDKIIKNILIKNLWKYFVVMTDREFNKTGWAE